MCVAQKLGIVRAIYPSLQFTECQLLQLKIIKGLKFKFWKSAANQRLGDIWSFAIYDRSLSYRAIHGGCHPILAIFPLCTRTLSLDFAFHFSHSQSSLFSHHFSKIQVQKTPKSFFFVIIPKAWKTANGSVKDVSQLKLPTLF